jgi:hypothetical protein
MYRPAAIVSFGFVFVSIAASYGSLRSEAAARPTATTSTSLGAWENVLATTPCAQPASSGSNPTASDCLFILRTAVGAATCTPECICAPKGTLPTTASDALLCLKKAVGQGVTLACPCEGTSTTLPTTTSTTADTTTTTTGGGSIENGRADYDARCSFCHSAGAYDPEAEFASDLAGDGDKLVSDLGTLDGDMEGILFTGDQIEDMAAFLDSLQ